MGRRYPTTRIKYCRRIPVRSVTLRRLNKWFIINNASCIVFHYDKSRFKVWKRIRGVIHIDINLSNFSIRRPKYVVLLPYMGKILALTVFR